MAGLAGQGGVPEAGTHGIRNMEHGTWSMEHGAEGRIFASVSPLYCVQSISSTDDGSQLD